jgi:hypothetical protein
VAKKKYIKYLYDWTAWALIPCRNSEALAFTTLPRITKAHEGFYISIRYNISHFGD